MRNVKLSRRTVLKGSTAVAALAETKPSDRMIAEPSSCPAMPFSARHF
jgi:hypothetical protein